MRFYNEQDKAVAAYLTAIGVAFSCEYRGEQTDNDGGTPWVYDLFIARFSRGGEVVETSYRQGTGLRVTADFDELEGEAAAVGAAGPEYLGAGAVKMPAAAGVLFCLMADADMGRELFADFCATMGYSTDSRKAWALYEECQKTAAGMRMFTAEERAELAEMLEDY